MLVNKFTNWALIKLTGKLPAFAGMAAAYEVWLGSSQPLKYLAGLWYHHRLKGLLWISNYSDWEMQ